MAAVPASSRFASDRWWRQAQACLARGQMEGARIALAELEAAGPARAVHALLLAAQLAWREDRIRDATRHALAAATAADDDPETVSIVVGVLLEVGENAVGRDCLDRLDAEASEDPRVLLRLALLRKRLEQHVEELALLDRAKSLGHDSAALRYHRGVALVYNGRLAEAEAELSSSLADAPDRGRVGVPLVGLRRQTPENNHLAALERGAHLAAPGSDDQAGFEFARYKTLEDLQRYEEAWRTLARGNALMRARVHDPAAQHHEWLERLMAAAEFVRRPGAVERPPGPVPIFIVGVPRCGSTVLERMVGNHSRVAVAGELHDLGAQLHWTADTRNAHTARMAERLRNLDYAELGRRYLARTQWRAQDRDFFTDKQPPNWALVPMIHAAMPWAPILNLVRDPMDTCFSNWRAYFGDACPYSYDLDALAAFYIDYRRVMDRWHELMPDAILDVHYADLVNEPDATLRKVFAFCGLAYEPGCEDITRNTAPSATLSAAQVRSPLRRDTAGHWRQYAGPLAGLAAALAQAGYPGAA